MSTNRNFALNSKTKNGILIKSIKALDTISDILLKYTERICIWTVVFSLFKSYLCHIKQKISIQEQLSHIRYIDCGVPQGTVLGPNVVSRTSEPFSMLKNKKAKLYMYYADDTCGSVIRCVL